MSEESVSELGWFILFACMSHGGSGLHVMPGFLPIAFDDHGSCDKPPEVSSPDLMSIFRGPSSTSSYS